MSYNIINPKTRGLGEIGYPDGGHLKSIKELCRTSSCYLELRPHAKNQVRTIVLDGIRGWNRRRTKAKTFDRGLFRTSKESMAGRIKKRTIGKTTWYKKRKGREQKFKDLGEQQNTKESTSQRRTTRSLKGGKQDPGVSANSQKQWGEGGERL